jgi:hypothetical protein
MKKTLIVFTLILTNTLFAQTIHNDSFTPIPGEKYILSAWVKDEVTTQVHTYTGNIQIDFIFDSGIETVLCIPKGNIIDGWQLITKEFTVPVDIETGSLTFKLVPKPNGVSYFDDIRVFPYNGNMKSFVYDPENQRLMAELDENNYAPFYEYDTEAGLVRVKKETEKGIYTIQETRSGNSKINN